MNNVDAAPCCGNCMNKSYKGEDSNGLTLYCEAKEQYVRRDGMCQWYDRNNNVWKKRNK